MSVIDEAICVKFERQIKMKRNIQKLQNYVKRGHVGSRDPLSEFRDPPPLISRERLKLETSNLAWRQRAVSTKEKKCKIGSKGVMWGSRDWFWNFGTPLISGERLKLQTSNLVWGQRAVSSNETNAKLGQRGHVGSREPIFEFWTPNISRPVEARNFKFGTETDCDEF